MKRATWSTLVAATVLYAAPAYAESNLLIILDSSNSMWGQIQGTAKIDTAKSVLRQTVTGLSSDINQGLMLYGHRERDNCADVQLVSPIGQGTAANIAGAVGAVTPKGKTPIAASLQRAATAFEGREEQTNNVLLISDGIETCGGDPCAEAAKLIERGINVKISVVGFDVDAETSRQLQCIAKAGKGEYYDAKDANQFKQALNQIEEVVVQAEPEPEPEPEPQTEIYFEDNFDGAELADHWEVQNPNPDAYLVENGFLTLVAADNTPADLPNTENVLRLNKPIPKGNWTMISRFTFRPQTMGEIMRMGLVTDVKNGLFSSMHLSNYNYARTNVFVRGDKYSRGKLTEFARNVYQINSRDLVVRADQLNSKVKAVQLKLTKTRSNYIASMRFESANPGAEGAVSEDWFDVQKLTSLRAPGKNFALYFSTNSNSYTANAGEGVVDIDWVKIELNK